jgi:hypothetical protein
MVGARRVQRLRESRHCPNESQHQAGSVPHGRASHAEPYRHPRDGVKSPPHRRVRTAPIPVALVAGALLWAAAAVHILHMSVLFRRVVSALALTVFSLRVLAPEVGHACGSMSDHTTAVASAPAGAVPTVADLGPSPHAPAADDPVHHHHGAPPAPETTVSVEPAALSSHDGVHDGSNDGTHDGSHDAPCDCSDWCCCLPTLTSPPRPVVASLRVTIVDGRAPTPWLSAVASAHRADRLLPFATAPPRA